MAHLRLYEGLLREVHLAGSRLAIEMRSAQVDLGLSPIAGHRILATLDEAQSQVSGALGTAALGHSRLRAFAHAIGIDPRGYGERTDPEDEEVRRQAGTTGSVAAA